MTGTIGRPLHAGEGSGRLPYHPAAAGVHPADGDEGVLGYGHRRDHLSAVVVLPDDDRRPPGSC